MEEVLAVLDKPMLQKVLTAYQARCQYHRPKKTSVNSQHLRYGYLVSCGRFLRTSIVNLTIPQYTSGPSSLCQS